MSGLSDVNMKQTLRKIEYPLCAREALNKIVDLLCGRNTSLKHMDLALDLMTEFVFYEMDRRGNKRNQSLTPLTELQLLEILFEYFNSISNESSRNTVFLSLFSLSTINSRANILSKLVSIAVGIRSATILISASTWMQQVGNTQINSKLADVLVNDYFFLVPQQIERLKVLPNVAPEFTANFLTAVAENYYNNNLHCSKKSKQLFPPQLLLETITLWIWQNNFLCTAAQNRQLSLPSGAIAMEATSPIAGLLRWCLLAPLYEQDNHFYFDLHLALLSSILAIPKVTPPKAICAQHLTASIPNILAYTNELKNIRKVSPGDDVRLNLSLDRFAQAVQMALSVECVYGNVEEMFKQLQQLPYNRLLNIVSSTHKQIK